MWSELRRFESAYFFAGRACPCGRSQGVSD
jgi:hypothetical protein